MCKMRSSSTNRLPVTRANLCWLTGAAHFAVDPDLVFATSHLQGRYGGAGNPPVSPTQDEYPTGYLWREIWAKDSVLNLILQFIHEVEEEDEEGKKTGKRFIIFPRYQQLDAMRRMVAAFLNTEGGDLLLGVADDGGVVGIEFDQLDNDDKFMLHLMQVVRNGPGDRAGTLLDPKTEMIEGKTVCLFSCRRRPEPVYLKWKGVEKNPEGDFYVRHGPGSVRLPSKDTELYINTRFPGVEREL